MSDERQTADPVGIGQRLRKCRVSRGLLQQDLATTEISTSYVSLIEGGKRSPSDAVLAVLAERVGTSVEYLRTGRDEATMTNLRLELGFAEMALRNGSQDEALQSFNSVLTKAQTLGPDLVMRARIGQAAALEGLGRLEAAIAILHELAEDRTLVAGSPQWAQVTVALCRCYRLVGDVNMSVDIGERGLRRLDELGLDVTDDHIMLGVNLVGCYNQRADYTRGHLLSNRLLAQAEENGSRSARGMVYWNASLIAESRGQRDEAVALVERALMLLAEADNPRHLARLKGRTAALLLNADGDLDRAKALLDQAKETLADVGTVHERGDIDMSLANLALRLGQFDEAEQLATSALALFGNEAAQWSAQAHVVLGATQLLNGWTAEGEESLRTAHRQLHQIPRSLAVVKTFRHLGDIWNQHGNVEEAMKAYQEALDLSGAESMPTPPKRSVAARVK